MVNFSLRKRRYLGPREVFLNIFIDLLLTHIKPLLLKVHNLIGLGICSNLNHHHTQDNKLICHTQKVPPVGQVSF